MKRILAIIAALLLCGAATGLLLLRRQALPIAQPVRIELPRGSDYAALVDSLDAHGCIVNRPLFVTAARLSGLASHVVPGSYELRPGMGLVRVVHKLRAGRQDPVRITLNKVRTLAQLCQFLGDKLQVESDTLLSCFSDPEFCRRHGSTPETVIGLFLPNTYEFYWTVTPDELADRMNKESERFWKKRETRLEALNLSRDEVLTLASIVEEETNCDGEKADIASVYLNRLRIGMALQADPTVRFAAGDFTVRRIGGAMLQNPSPYNTYRHTGLPPGPICTPSAASVDAVLENKHTDYLFFCAKEDFSGRHRFASNLTQHQHNAQLFHQALNQRGIK